MSAKRRSRRARCIARSTVVPAVAAPSWCCWPVRPSTSFSPCCCWPACSWVNGVTEVRAVVGEVTAGTPAHQAGPARRRRNHFAGWQGGRRAGRRAAGPARRDVRRWHGCPAPARDPAGSERDTQIVVADAAARPPPHRTRSAAVRAGFRLLAAGAAGRDRCRGARGSGRQGRGCAKGDTVLAVNGTAVRDFVELRQRGRTARRRRRAVQCPARWPGSRAAHRRDRGDGRGSARRSHRHRVGTFAAWPASMLRHTRVGPWAAIGMGVREAWT